MRSLSLLLGAAGLTCALLLTAISASADVTFDLTDVPLYTGATPSGTLTGDFVTNDALTSLVSADITASASGTYTGQTYTLSNSTDNSVLPGFIQLNLNPVTSTSSELRLIFSGALTASGATLDDASFEFEITGGERFVESGSVTPATTPITTTPEPSSAALTATSLIGLLMIAFGLKPTRRPKTA
jgi:hypothetical protein